MKQHTRHIPDDLDAPETCTRCGALWPCAGARYHQSRCGCWQSQLPSRRPWYYWPGGWHSWSPISLGGDEFCRRTLVLGFGWITGVLVIPLRECRGCGDCGPKILDGVQQRGALRPRPPRRFVSADEAKRILRRQRPTGKSAEDLQHWYDELDG